MDVVLIIYFLLNTLAWSVRDRTHKFDLAQDRLHMNEYIRREVEGASKLNYALNLYPCPVMRDDVNNYDNDDDENWRLLRGDEWHLSCQILFHEIDNTAALMC